MTGTVFYGQSRLFLEDTGGFYTTDEFGFKYWDSEGRLRVALHRSLLLTTSAYGFSASGQMWAEVRPYYDSAGNLRYLLRVGRLRETLATYSLPIGSFARGSLALDESGTLIAFAFTDWQNNTTLRVWRREGGTLRELHTVPLPAAPMETCVEPTGRYWIGVNDTLIIRVDLQIGVWQQQVYSEYGARFVALSPTGRYVAQLRSDFSEYSLRVWRTEDAVLVHAMPVSEGFRINRIAVSDAYLAVKSDSHLQVWRLGEAQPILEQVVPYCRFASLAVSHDRVMLICRERFVEVALPSLQVRELPYMPYPPHSVSVAPQGDLLVICLNNLSSDNREILFHRLSDGARVDFPVPTTGWAEAALSPDGRWLALQEGQGLLNILDLQTGARRFQTRLHEGLFGRIFDFSADGRYLLSGGMQVRAFSTADWRLRSIITLSQEFDMRALRAAVPYTDWLWECDWDGLYQWDLRTGQLVRTLPFEEELQEGWKQNFVVTSDGALGVIVMGGLVVGYDLLQGRPRWLTPVQDSSAAQAMLDPHERWAFVKVARGLLVIRLTDGAVLKTISYDAVPSVMVGVRHAPPGIVMREGTVVALYRLPDSRLQGDANLDGCVDEADLLEVLFAFGGATPPSADVNADGRIDDADLLTVLFHFAEGCQP
ncbi:MAG: hypothetical protein NZ556_09595 [Fimbriimonadales bacterium]|nr:hypothetical protein [Fimbriimonadales bacterium]